MTRALIAVGAGPAILSPVSPFEVMAQPGDVVWDDDPLIFGTAALSSSARAAMGLLAREPACLFTATEEEEPTNRSFSRDAELYAAIEYEREA